MHAFRRESFPDGRLCSSSGDSSHQPCASSDIYSCSASITVPELGIRRVERVKRLGRRIGNWLTGDQAQELLNAVSQGTLRGKEMQPRSDCCSDMVLLRSETVNQRLDQLQLRENHWVIVDMVGKGGRLRTVPVPA